MTGDAGQRRVRLDRLQRGVAVHDRHHDVEQDDVDRAFGEPVEGFATVNGLDHVMTLLRECRAEDRSVEALVIDDEDPATRGHQSAADGVEGDPDVLELGSSLGDPLERRHRGDPPARPRLESAAERREMLGTHARAVRLEGVGRPDQRLRILLVDCLAASRRAGRRRPRGMS